MIYIEISIPNIGISTSVPSYMIIMMMIIYCFGESLIQLDYLFADFGIPMKMNIILK